MTKKERQEAAQATLEGLREVGSGWVDLVAIMVLRGDHKELGLTVKEFANQAGGYKVTDSRQVILDLNKKGLSKKAIGEVLSMDPDREVSRVLYEAGRINTLPKKATPGYDKARLEAKTSGDAGDSGEESSGDAGSSDRIAELEAEIEAARTEVRAARNANAEERAKLKQDIKDLRKRLREEGQKNKEDDTDDEVIVQLEEQLERMTDQMTVGIEIAHTIGLINDAREELAQLISKGITRDQINRIDTAMAALNNEYEVAKGTAALNN